MMRKGDWADREPPEEAAEGTEEIDRALREMAETAPEAPADFHDRWMGAVREEAGKRPRIPWVKILSTAAVVVVVVLPSQAASARASSASTVISKSTFFMGSSS